MKTKSSLIPGFTAYDVTPAITNNQPVPLAVVPTIAPASIPQRLTHVTTSCILTPPLLSASEDSDDDDGSPVPPPTPHTPLDMSDTNAPLTPSLPCELQNLETFYNPKPGDQGNIALLTLSTDTNEDEMLAYPYKEPRADLEIISDVEFCNAHLPEHDSNPQSAAQALLSKKTKYWWESMNTEFLNCEEKNTCVIVPKSKVPKGRKIIGNRWVYAEKDDGTYRSHSVAKGFSQITGKEHHSPVVCCLSSSRHRHHCCHVIMWHFYGLFELGWLLKT
jgi:Reverse transcriptase (RNA-dependent DNA polymerase)